MRTLIVFLLSLVLISCGTSTKEQDKIATKSIQNQTKIKFDKELHNFNSIKNGEIVGCYFKYTNTGETPLLINNVKPGCGCTTVNYTKEPVLPGEEGEIEIRFNSNGFSGKQYKIIKVEANIPNQFIELVISANVIN